MKAVELVKGIRSESADELLSTPVFDSSCRHFLSQFCEVLRKNSNAPACESLIHADFQSFNPTDNP